MKVECPLCKRLVSLDKLGACDLNGERVMEWHLCTTKPHHKECAGSHKSVKRLTGIEVCK